MPASHMSQQPAAPVGGETAPGHNLPEYSVGEISAALKRTLEATYGRVRVRGEVSGFKRAASGHLYFALKDEDAVLDAVCWRGVASGLAVAPEDGMELVCSGRITTYAGRSKYQIVIEAVELAGEGALLKLLEDRRKKLADEGLFDPERKKPLPFLPEVIGVVTSPTGAVIRDILHRLADRFPRPVLLWPVLVQGEGAAEQVAAAIEGFNRLPGEGPVARPDLLIVARGGGSLEDLWAFNEEVVVRAAAASDIPLISAVGHETDTTLLDFAADVRAPTPSAAAEMAVPVRAELLAKVLDGGRRMVTGLARALDERRLRVDGLARGLPDPRSVLDAATQRLDDRAERLRNAAATMLEVRGHRLEAVAAGVRRRSLEERIARGRERTLDQTERLSAAAARCLADPRARLDSLAALLEGFSYERVLERGFVLVRGADDRPLTSAGEAKPGLDVALRFHDGEAAARITGRGRPKPRGRGKKGGEDAGGQGSLL